MDVNPTPRLRLAIDGHRLSPPEVTTLLTVLGWDGMAATLKQQGYKLLPIRAPRRLAHGRTTFRLCWECREPDAVLRVRMAAVVEAQPVA